MHYIKKFLNGETDTKLMEWYGKSNVAATVYTLVVFFFAIIGAIAADVVNSQTSFWAAMYSGFVTGFAIDAGFNGDARQMNRDLKDTKKELKEFLTKDDRVLIEKTDEDEPDEDEHPLHVINRLDSPDTSERIESQLGGH